MRCRRRWSILPVCRRAVPDHSRPRPSGRRPPRLFCATAECGYRDDCRPVTESGAVGCDAVHDRAVRRRGAKRVAATSNPDPTAHQPRTKPSEERRRDLLDAGLAVFRRRGVAAARVEEIVREAGVAKGTFYLYFPSKEHLVVALQRDFESSVVARIAAAVAAAGDDWAERLDAWVLAVFDDFPAGRALHEVIYHYPVEVDRTTAPQTFEGGPAGPDSPERPRNELVANLASLMSDGIAAGAYDVDDPTVTAALL